MASIHKKLSNARLQIAKTGLKKSGKNNFSHYSYFTLEDILAPSTKALHESGLIAVITFEDDQAIMTISEFDGDGEIVIRSPNPSGAAKLKGCHEIQNIGAAESYQRRYLWMTALEIAEIDMLEGSDVEEPEDDGVDRNEIISTIRKAVAEYGSVTKVPKDIQDVVAEFGGWSDLRKFSTSQLQSVLSGLEAHNAA